MTIRQKVAKFVAQQRAMRELSQLDNRQLDDLGITRGDIRNLVQGRSL